jgi:hypothetical protein
MAKSRHSFYPRQCLLSKVNSHHADLSEVRNQQNNRKLKRLVAVELKQGNFKAEYKGQMELYLRWLAKYEREVDEEPPLGIILCAGASSG